MWRYRFSRDGEFIPESASPILCTEKNDQLEGDVNISKRFSKAGCCSKGTSHIEPRKLRANYRTINLSSETLASFFEKGKRFSQQTVERSFCCLSVLLPIITSNLRKRTYAGRKWTFVPGKDVPATCEWTARFRDQHRRQWLFFWCSWVCCWFWDFWRPFLKISTVIHIKCEANVSLFCLDFTYNCYCCVSLGNYSRHVKCNCPRIFQPVIFHVIDVPVILSTTDNRDFECTKNCIMIWNFPHMRFR